MTRPLRFSQEFILVRYHYEKPPIYFSKYGITYKCDHPVYSKCTLFKIDDKGLAVIQQRYDPKEKITKQGDIDLWLTDDLYLHKGFMDFFNDRSGENEDGLYLLGYKNETFAEKSLGNVF